MIRTALRPWTSPTTWWALVLLCTGFAIGHVTTIFVVTVGAVALSTAIIVPFALVAVWVLFVAGHGMARFERARYRIYAGVDLVDPSPPAPGHNWWTRWLGRLRTPARWRELLYLVLRLPVSAVLCGVALLVWAGSAALGALPLYVARLPAESIDVGLFRLTGGAGVWIASLLGVALFLLFAPWVTTALHRVDVAFGRSLLAHGAKTELEAAFDRLGTSLVAAVDSAETERRRIERDLHDGAQQRLIAAAMDLGVARERLVTDPPAGQALVASAHDEVKAALRELRDLVRGIHPVILEDRGLDAALSAVVARSPVPVDLSVHTDPRPSPAIESAAYFIVSESLTNVARHAQASSVAVTIESDRTSLRLRVRDDGRGGADADRGTGLAGLAERVAALGGTFALDSPPGGPTELRVELPCAS